MISRHIATITAAAVIIIGGLFLLNTFRKPGSTAYPPTTQPQTVSVALVQLEGSVLPDGAVGRPQGEAFGCGDYIVMVDIPRPDVQNDLGAALTALFAIKEPTQTYLYNGLHLSTFEVDTISTVGGNTHVALKGTLRQGGICDSPRIKTQIEETIRQFTTSYTITLNASEAAYRCIGNESGECQ